VSPVGSYPITASGAASTDYAITYVAGALTVTTPTKGVALLASDPLNPGSQALYVSGTSGNDVILITGVASSCGTVIWVHTETPGAPSGTATDVIFPSPVSRIIVYGQAGDDSIGVISNLPAAAWLYGNDGNDLLVTATTASNVLVGGAGNDVLVG